MRMFTEVDEWTPEQTIGLVPAWRDHEIWTSDFLLANDHLRSPINSFQDRAETCPTGEHFN